MAEIKDDASAWYESIGQDIQDYEVPEMPQADDTIEADQDTGRPYGDAPEVTNDDVRNVMNMQTINRPTATVIVGVMDTLVPVLVTALIVKGSELGDTKLTEEERETLIDAWALYLGDKQVQASPGVILMTTILTIYGSKLFAAMQNRKMMEQQRLIEVQREEIENQTGEIERLRHENEELQRKKEERKG